MANLVDFTIEPSGLIEYKLSDGTVNRSHIEHASIPCIINEMRQYGISRTDHRLPAPIIDAWDVKITHIKISQNDTLITVERHYDVLGINSVITRYNTNRWNFERFQERMLSYNVRLVFDDSVIDTYRFNSPE